MWPWWRSYRVISRHHSTLLLLRENYTDELSVLKVLLCMGYWPSVRSRWLDVGQYPTILTEQTWSIKDLLYGFRGNFSCGIQRVVPSTSRAGSRSGRQSQRAIWFIFPARWASQIIMLIGKFSAPTIAFLAFWLAKKLRLWANSSVEFYVMENSTPSLRIFHTQLGLLE